MDRNHGPNPDAAVVEDCTCLGCGCLCDDIAVRSGSGQVVEAAHACDLGRAWFAAPHPGAGGSAALVDGEPATLDAALDRAAAIFHAARSPLVWGMGGLTVEAAAVALGIADRVGAAVDPGGEPHHLAAFRRVGSVGASFGEIRDRADLIVLWRVDPAATHPRFLERFVDRPGTFVGQGRGGRTVVAVGDGPPSSAVDHVLAVDPARAGALLHALRGIVLGRPLTPDRVEAATGLPFAAVNDLATLLLGARYGVFVTGDACGDAAEAEAILALVRDLNRPEGRRFVHVGLNGPGNRAGVAAASTWQLGSPGPVDLALGFPRSLPVEAGWRERRDRVDALLVLDRDDPPGRPADLPTIRIGPGATRADLPPATVAIDAARPGIEAGGTAGRSDGVMLPLRPPLATGGLPTEQAILAAILARLQP